MRKAKITPYTSLAGFDCGNDPAGNMAIFLLTKTGSIFGTWHGRLTAADQRKLFGKYLGKATLSISGEDEMLKHTVMVCFGTDCDTTHNLAWRDLPIIA
jgi:hypothetical protein